MGGPSFFLVKVAWDDHSDVLGSIKSTTWSSLTLWDPTATSSGIYLPILLIEAGLAPSYSNLISTLFVDCRSLNSVANKFCISHQQCIQLFFLPCAQVLVHIQLPHLCSFHLPNLNYKFLSILSFHTLPALCITKA